MRTTLDAAGRLVIPKSIRLLQRATEHGVTGGQIYDAVIVACAIAGSVDTILTFNARHFHPPRVAGLEIVVPA